MFEPYFAIRMFQSLVEQNLFSIFSVSRLLSLVNFDNDANLWKIIDVLVDGICWKYSIILSLWNTSEFMRNNLSLNTFTYRKQISNLLLHIKETIVNETQYWKRKSLLPKDRVYVFEGFCDIMGFDSIFSEMITAIKNAKPFNCLWRAILENNCVYWNIFKDLNNWFRKVFSKQFK